MPFSDRNNPEKVEGALQRGHTKIHIVNSRQKLSPNKNSKSVKAIKAVGTKGGLAPQPFPEGALEQFTFENLIKTNEMSTESKIEAVTPRLHFNLKITDISEIKNPFTILFNKHIDKDGCLMLSETSSQNPCSLFAWLKKP